ncbi:MAG: universal stress protein [Acidimicrobiia bacterium]|nr:universal stress protein [Acidimicrobiia bacterium]
MHVLIATTGALSPGPVARFAQRLAGDDKVTVTTVVGIPRSFLEVLRSEEWHPLATEDESATRSAQEETLVGRYVEERGRKLTDPIIAALRAEGIEATPVYLEGEDPAAVISRAAEDLDVDVVILGATRKIFDDWESVSARVMIESQWPVLVVPAPSGEATPDPIDWQESK